MKLKHIIYIVFINLFVLNSCNKPDEFFAELVSESNLNYAYPTGIDSVIVENKFGGVDLTLLIPVNSGAEGCILVRNSDTLKYNFTEKISGEYKISLDNLPAGDIQYELLTFDKNKVFSPKKKIIQASIVDANTKLEELVIWRGYNRMLLEFTAPRSTFVQKIAIAGLNQDTVFYSLDPTKLGTKQQISIPLAEGDYNFEILLVSNTGSKTNPDSRNVNVYGPQYKRSLAFQDIDDLYFSWEWYDYYYYFKNFSTQPDIVSRLVKIKLYYSGVYVVKELPLKATEGWTYYLADDYFDPDGGFYYAYKYLPSGGIDPVETDYKLAEPIYY